MFVGAGVGLGAGLLRGDLQGWLAKRAGEGDYSAGVPVKLTE